MRSWVNFEGRSAIICSLIRRGLGEEEKRWEKLRGFGSSRGGMVLPFIRVVNIAVETDLGEEIESSVLDMLSSRCLLSMHTKSITSSWKYKRGGPGRRLL